MHCGQAIASAKCSREHVPTKALLDQPFPGELATVTACEPCNNSYSKDEDYFVAFLSCVLSGSTQPDHQVIKSASGILSHSSALRESIKREKKEYETLGGDQKTIWQPSLDRIRSFLVKNARAHLFYENGEPIFDEPRYVWFSPVQTMSEDDWRNFLGPVGGIGLWCEVGSRWNTRLIEGDTFDDAGFLVVQNGIYRFRIEGGGCGVRSIIREYLATSVIW